MYFEITTVTGEFVYINMQQITAVEPVEHAVCTSDGSRYKMTPDSYDSLIKNLGIVWYECEQIEFIQSRSVLVSEAYIVYEMFLI